MQAEGAGVIRRIWLTVSDRSPEMLRSLTLAMYWDGQTNAAVRAPLGDFFSVSHGRMTAYESALFSNPEGRSFNTVIPMPFRRGARVVLTNESSKNLSHLFYDVDFETIQRPAKNFLYFHCYWNRQLRPTLGQDVEILPKIGGKGRFLGMNVGVIANPDYGKSWWGEGEVKIYLDGDSTHPTAAGTGTEDYVGAAWGLGRFANRYQGCPVADSTNRLWSFYRLHVPDPIFFAKDVRVTLQAIGGSGAAEVRRMVKEGLPLIPVSIDNEGQFTRLLEPGAPKLGEADGPSGWVNFYRQDDYSTTAYFYLDRPTHDLPGLPPLATRISGLIE